MYNPKVILLNIFKTSVTCLHVEFVSMTSYPAKLSKFVGLQFFRFQTGILHLIVAVWVWLSTQDYNIPVRMEPRMVNPEFEP